MSCFVNMDNYVLKRTFISLCKINKSGFTIILNISKVMMESLQNQQLNPQYVSVVWNGGLKYIKCDLNVLLASDPLVFGQCWQEKRIWKRLIYGYHYCLKSHFLAIHSWVLFGITQLKFSFRPCRDTQSINHRPFVWHVVSLALISIPFNKDWLSSIFQKNSLIKWMKYKRGKTEVELAITNSSLPITISFTIIGRTSITQTKNLKLISILCKSIHSYSTAFQTVLYV